MSSKFRVYDKQEKKLYKPDTMGELFYLFALTMDERLGRFNEDLDGYETCDPDRYVVEFSTGLKDKNGVEIYEGDIWKTENKKGLDPYGGKCDRWKAIKITVIREGLNFSGLPDEEYTSMFHARFIEIIGNIHGEADGKD